MLRCQVKPLVGPTRTKTRSTRSLRCEKLLIRVEEHNIVNRSRRYRFDIENEVWATEVTTSLRPNCARRREIFGGKRKRKGEKRTNHIKSGSSDHSLTQVVRDTVNIHFSIMF
jgi:hypothetical protein